MSSRGERVLMKIGVWNLYSVVVASGLDLSMECFLAVKVGACAGS